MFQHRTKVSGIRKKASNLVLLLIIAFALLHLSSRIEDNALWQSAQTPNQYRGSIVNDYRVYSSAYQQNKSRVAIVYAAASFHEEVTSSVVCILHELGLYVTVYIQSGVFLSGVKLPFSDKRRQKSGRFYGHCVDKWVTLGDGYDTSQCSNKRV